MSIKMTPFMALYSYEAPSFMDLVLGDSRVPKAKNFLQDSQDILRVLKENIQQAQNKKKLYADQHQIECNFEVGDMVYLRLQLYRQSSLKKNGAEKLKPRFYGPYKVIHKVGEVAYEIELLEGSWVHNMFHVSRLKKAIRQRVVPSAELPPLDEEGKLILIPEAILDIRERTL